MFDAVKSKLLVLRPPVELEFPNPIEFACVEGVGTAEEDTDILSLLLQLPPLLLRFPSTTLRRARSSLSSASALDVDDISCNHSWKLRRALSSPGELSEEVSTPSLSP